MVRHCLKLAPVAPLGRMAMFLPRLRLTAIHPWLTLVCAVALLSLEALPAHAQRDWSVRGWSSDSGLPVDEDYGLAQGADGYLWIATSQGVFRFDGTRFAAIAVPELAHEYDNMCNVVYAAPDGSIWWALDHGRAVRWCQGETSAWRVAQGMPNGLPTSICQNRDGTVFIGYHRDGVAEIKDGKVKLFFTPAGEPEPSRCYVASDGDGNAWCVSGKRLLEFRNGDFIQVGDLPTGSHSGLMAARTGGLWVEDWHMLRHFAVPGGHEDQEIALPTDIGSVTALYEVAAGALWIGTSDSPRSGLYQYANGQLAPVGVERRQVTSITADREGNLWLTTLDDGIKQLRPALIRFLNIGSGLPAWGRVCSFVKDGAGQLWVVLEDNSVFCQTGDQWKQIREFSRSPDSIGKATAVDVAPDGSVLIATSDNALFTCADANSTPVPLPGAPALYHVITILSSTTGDLWISANRAQLARMRDGKVTEMMNPELATAPLLAQGANGDLLMAGTGHTGEGCLYHFAGGKIVDLPFPGSGEYPIHALWQDKDGSIWIGFLGGGLGRLKDGHFTRVTAKDGLADDYVYQVLPDGQGRIWLISSTGLSRIDTAEFDRFASGESDHLRVVSFAPEERDIATEAVTRSIGLYVGYCCRIIGDELWFSYGNGILIVNPGAWACNNIAPPVVIEAVQVDGRDVPMGAPTPQPLKLAPSHSRLEFDYAALSFAAPENNQYRYMLEGYDKQWIDAGTERQAIYSRLAPGNYRFRVVACNSDGIWNEVGAGVPFTVTPFFWQTWWFRLLLLFVFACIVGALVRYLSHRRFQVRLRALERQAALDQERDRIAKDLHDDLGGSLTKIALLGELTLKQQAVPAVMGEQVKQISSEVRQVIKSLDATVWAVNPHNDTLADMIDYIGQFALDFLATAGIRCRIDTPDFPDHRPLSSEARHNLFLVVKEALHNIVRHAQAGEVWLRLLINPRSIAMTIEDNGRGFDQALACAGADGLRNMRHRMEAIGGRLEIESAPGNGTRVRFVYPCQEIESSKKSAAICSKEA